MARGEADRKAEAKIEQALRNGLTDLDLSYMKLTELPRSQSLNLSSNPA